MCSFHDTFDNSKIQSAFCPRHSHFLSKNTFYIIKNSFVLCLARFAKLLYIAMQNHHFDWNWIDSLRFWHSNQELNLEKLIFEHFDPPPKIAVRMKKYMMAKTPPSLKSLVKWRFFLFFNSFFCFFLILLLFYAPNSAHIMKTWVPTWFCVKSGFWDLPHRNLRFQLFD